MADGPGRVLRPAAATKIAADYGLTALAPGAAFAVYALISLTVGFVPKRDARWARKSAGAVSRAGLSKVTGFVGTSLISGLMWSLWHFPAILLTDYNGGTPP